MKTRANHKKSGGILVIAVMVAFILSILIIGLYRMFQADVVEAIGMEHHRRAFWLAEQGLEEVSALLFADENFRDFPSTYVPYTVAHSGGSFSNGSYTIESVSTSSLGATGTVYTVISRGDASGIIRRIQQNIISHPGGPSAIRSTRGDIQMDSNVYIDGNVFADVGDVTIQAKENLSSTNPTGINGFLSAGGTVDGRGSRTVDQVVIAPPPQPTIDMAYWTPFIDNVRVDTNANTSSSISSDPFTITTGVTNYHAATPPLKIASNITLDGTASGPDGFHFLASATDLLIDNWLTLAPRSVIVVDGNIVIDQKLTFLGECVVFATGDIDVRQSFDTVGIGGTFIALGNLSLAQSMVFSGIFFAEGNVTVGSNSEVTGTIIAGGDISLDSNVEVTYDPDVFLTPLPGISNVFNQATIIPGSWAEIGTSP